MSQVVANQFLENQDVYFKPSVVPGNQSFAETMDPANIRLDEDVFETS